MLRDVLICQECFEKYHENVKSGKESLLKEIQTELQEVRARLQKNKTETCRACGKRLYSHKGVGATMMTIRDKILPESALNDVKDWGKRRAEWEKFKEDSLNKIYEEFPEWEQRECSCFFCIEHHREGIQKIKKKWWQNNDKENQYKCTFCGKKWEPRPVVA